jgi:hypothetical protein
MTGGEDRDPMDAEPAASAVWTAVLVAVATLAGYLGWLGWDQHKDAQPDGSLTGPYQSWQVAGLVLVLAAVAAVASLRGRPMIAVVVGTVVTTACFSVDAATEPPITNDGLWPIGAAMVALGTCGGLALVGAITTMSRRTGSRRR